MKIFDYATMPHHSSIHTQTLFLPPGNILEIRLIRKILHTFWVTSQFDPKSGPGSPFPGGGGHVITPQALINL